jgi:hypothetical protein
LPAGTVARGYLREDAAYYAGRNGDQFVSDFPVPVTRQLLQRGQERFNIFCAPCHSRVGDRPRHDRAPRVQSAALVP